MGMPFLGHREGSVTHVEQRQRLELSDYQMLR
jgi:hypothetical protein